jgi:hypothetical protein
MESLQGGKEHSLGVWLGYVLEVEKKRQQRLPRSIQIRHGTIRSGRFGRGVGGSRKECGRGKMVNAECSERNRLG